MQAIAHVQLWNFEQASAQAQPGAHVDVDGGGIGIGMGAGAPASGMAAGAPSARSISRCFDTLPATNASGRPPSGTARARTTPALRPSTTTSNGPDGSPLSTST